MLRAIGQELWCSIIDDVDDSLPIMKSEGETMVDVMRLDTAKTADTLYIEPIQYRVSHTQTACSDYTQ